LSALDEGVGRLTEADVFARELARQVFVLVNTDPRIEGEVRADAQEHASPVPVTQIEVVLPHEPGADLDAIATARRRIADGNSGVLTTLQDDHNAEAAAETLVEGLDPVLSSHAFGRLNDVDSLLECQVSHKLVVVLGYLAEVGPTDRGHVLAFIEIA